MKKFSVTMTRFERISFAMFAENDNDLRVKVEEFKEKQGLKGFVIETSVDVTGLETS